MVFDVPAESGGALTILKQYYKKAIQDIDHEWIFVVSTPYLVETDNVKIINFPWVKKSWLHRLYFDFFIANKLVRKYQVDEILSLQNLIIPFVKTKQTIYLHQSLPFSNIRFGITENFKFWIYQNLIGKMIINSIKKADKVIVQTKWIMEAALEKTKTNKGKFIHEQPELNVMVKKMYDPSNNTENTFFYPASAAIYKNHEIIVKVCMKLKKNNIENYKVIFTLNGDENKYIKKIKKTVVENKLPIEFIGLIDIDSVYQYYSKSILLFPSYIETFGLPLLEAKKHNAPIITSETPFSHEILDDYDKVKFFNPFNVEELYNSIKIMLSYN